MELFSVICTTCQSKLKVRDRAIIGQILACPKCQGMVLVAPPAGWIDPGAVVAPVPVATPAPSTSAKPTPASHSSSNFEDAAALFEQPTGVSAPPVQAASASAADGEAATASSELPPQQQWLSPQTQAMRRWVLVGGLAMVGAIGLIGALVWALSGGDQTPLASADSPPVVQETPTDEDPAPDEIPPESEPTLEPAAVEPATEPTPDPAPMPAESEPAVEPAPPEAAEGPKPQTDPPAGDDNEAPKPLNTFSVENTLQQFGSLIENRAPSAAPGEAMPDAPEPLPDITDPPVLASDDELLARPEMRKIDVPRRLADPLEAFEMTEVPLAYFLQLLTDLTALPITLDPTALPAIKTSPEARVTVQLKSTTVNDVLTAALKPLNLTHIASDTQVVVLPMASTKTELREIKHDISDLATSAAEATVLAEIIHAVIEPDGWDDARGAGTLTVEGTNIVCSQTPEAHFAIVVLCEKLRLARKLPPRSNYPASVLTLTPRAIAADPVLDTPLTMNFVPPTRLGRVADYIKKTTGLRVLIDWRALLEAGWSPEAEVKVGVADQPLRAFLDRLSRRMEIAWRVIDASTVQLTTPAALLAQPDVEVYPVVTGESAALLARLQKELGSDLFAPGSPGALRYDSKGQALVARLPQPAQKKLIELLAKMAE